MDQDYRVVYLGRLRGGQTIGGVAGRLSAALGRDRAGLETMLAGPERTVLCTASAESAERLAGIFSHSGAEVRLDKPGGAHPEVSPQAITPSAGFKGAIPSSFRQRIWLIRAVVMLSLITTVAALAFGMVVAAFFVLLFSYSWVVKLIPLPALILPTYTILGVFHLLVIAALVKPFLRFESGRPRAIKLKRSDEAELFDFTVQICDTIGVPYPRAIYVDMSPAVRAEVWPGSDLTIGLPLIAAGITSAELGGWVARALSPHIGGMSGKLGRFVAGTVHGIHDAVHGRDAFDHLLERGMQANNRMLASGAGGLAKLIERSRRILGFSSIRPLAPAQPPCGPWNGAGINIRRRLPERNASSGVCASAGSFSLPPSAPTKRSRSHGRKGGLSPPISPRP